MEEGLSGRFSKLACRMQLFSYCIPIDDGAAPNPFWDVCTLAICKPMIRRIAEVGDWVAGIGSSNVEGRDYSGKLVYAMKVTQKMSFQKYQRHCKMMLPEKIPDITHSDYRRQVGDCIYNFERDWQNGEILPSVHTIENKETDLRGMNVLLSKHFYYFGNNAVPIAEKFNVLIRQGPGHQSLKNQSIKNEFIAWLEGEFQENEIYGEPQVRITFENLGEARTKSCAIRCNAAKTDENLPADDDRLPLSHWNYFLALEADLKTISRYVEIHKANYKTFSIGITQLFLATCSEIDVILKEICKVVSLNKVKNIADYHKVVAEKLPLLFETKVAIPLYQIELRPFVGWQGHLPPDWWKAYTDVKHHRNTHYAQANLINCLNALSALYIVTYELIRVYKGKTQTEYSGKLIYRHLQPRQELFQLEDEDIWRDIAEGKSTLLAK